MGTRTLLLVRHGQYALDEAGSLTALGREQARVTGAWIANDLDGIPVAALWSSTLPRARETAAIIANSIPNGKVRPVGVLREGIYSRIRGYKVSASKQREDRVRADAAWKRFFKTSRADRLELLVCHGNLIRYLVCRALHVSILRWIRMNSSNCAMTRVLIRDTGAIRVVSYNETAHLPADLVT